MGTTHNKHTVKFRLLDSYLAVIKNSVGSRMFRNLYASVAGVTTDVSRDGQLSCAFFVSSVLTMLALAKSSHATVTSTIRDLRESGWQEVPINGAEPLPGSVLVWEKIDFGDNNLHGHIGFYIGNGTAISNDETTGVPAAHPWLSPKRKIEFIFWHPKLSDEKTKEEERDVALFTRPLRSSVSD